MMAIHYYGTQWSLSSPLFATTSQQNAFKLPNISYPLIPISHVPVFGKSSQSLQMGLSPTKKSRNKLEGNIMAPSAVLLFS
jgi:hypothetical protein